MAVKTSDFETKVLDSLSKISNKLIDHENGFEKVESGIKDFMLTHFDRIYYKLERLEQEYEFINTALKRLEEKTGKVYQEEINAIKKQTLSLLGRIEKLEAKVGV
jgi:uncharacterized protein YdcH (DUF465 family)